VPPGRHVSRRSDGRGSHSGDAGVLVSAQGQADASSFVGLARASAEVINVSALTPEAVRRYAAAGIGAVFPYSVLNPALDAAGIRLVEQIPACRRVAGESLEHGRGRRPAVDSRRKSRSRGGRSAHITSAVRPSGELFGHWRSGILAIKAELDGFAGAVGPDRWSSGSTFKSTPGMRQFRDLLTNGYRDAVEQAGAGFAPTFRPTLGFRRSSRLSVC
jgi:hypothetical protein